MRIREFGKSHLLLGMLGWQRHQAETHTNTRDSFVGASKIVHMHSLRRTKYGTAAENSLWNTRGLGKLGPHRLVGEHESGTRNTQQSSVQCLSRVGALSVNVQGILEVPMYSMRLDVAGVPDCAFE